MIGMKRIYYFQIMILSVFMLPLGGCFDSEINRSIYEADAEEMQRENHIVGATLRGMQGLVIPTREHLYQFMDAMAGGAYGGYLEGIVDTWVMKFSTFNPEQGWLKSPFADPITEMYPPRYAEQDGRPRGAGFRKSTSRMYHAPGDGYVRSDSLLQHDE